MKIRTRCRVETSDLITLPVKDEAEARALVGVVSKQPHVLGCRFKGMSGTDKAIFAMVIKLPKGVVEVAPEVGTNLTALGYAEEIKPEPAAA